MANYSINKLRGGLKIMFDKPCSATHNVSSAMTSHYHATKQILAFSLACLLATPALAQLAGVDAFSPIGEHNSEAAIIIAQAEHIRLKVKVYLEGALSADSVIPRARPPARPPRLSSISITPAEIRLEEGDRGSILTITATPPPTQRSTITLHFDADEIAITPDPIVLGAGRSSINVVVTALADDVLEAEERTTITLADTKTLRINKDSSQSVVIIAGAPVINITPAEIRLAEGDRGSILTIAATPPPTQRSTITLHFDAGEIAITPDPIVLGAGRSNINVVVTALADDVLEAEERTTITLADTKTLRINKDSSQSVVIIAGAPVISITPAEIGLAEGGEAGMLTVTATPPPTQRSTIILGFDASEIVTTPDLIVLEAGQSNANVVVVALADDVPEAEERITITLVITKPLRIDADSSQSVVIIAATPVIRTPVIRTPVIRTPVIKTPIISTPVISITPTEIRLAEGGAGSILIIAAEPPPTQRSTITLHFDDSEIAITPDPIVLEAGRSNINVVVTALADDVLEAEERTTIALVDTEILHINKDSSQSVVIIAATPVIRTPMIRTPVISTPVISITPTEIRLEENGKTDILTIAAKPPPTQRSTITLHFDDSEIAITPDPIVLEAGQSSANVVVTALVDGVPETTERTTIALDITKTPSIDKDSSQSAVVIVEQCAAIALTVVQSLEPGERFQDCDGSPEMVVLPPGNFSMGAPPEDQQYMDEGPAHRVTITYSFAVGVYEVTFNEWDYCVQKGGCNNHRPDDEGWGRGERPVIHVSWYDASTYVKWLSKETGKPYRLLTEAEWEYATRAGTTTSYYFGDTISTNQANHNNIFGRTTPTGSFPANDFGLHDMHGNVWEWLEDCWHDDYKGAPTDGSAWIADGDCNERVRRGGSWDSQPGKLRSASREWDFVINRDNTANRDSNTAGFRVALTLIP